MNSIDVNLAAARAMVSIPRRVVVVILGSFYLLAFVMSPYWLLAAGRGLAIPALGLILVLGASWLYVASGDVRARFHRQTWTLLGLAALLVTVLNFRTLTSVFPWRGDEDYHVAITNGLVNRVPAVFMILGPLLLALIVYAVARRSRQLLLLGMLLAIGGSFAFVRASPFDAANAGVVVRYPYVNYWFYAFGPIIVKTLWNPYQEILYRIVPVLAAIALVWTFGRRLAAARLTARILWMLCIATIPVVFYYSSILYLEMPAVFLMTVVCLNAGSLLQDDFRTIRTTPAWYALLLIGFIKETVVIFLLCFLVCRVVVFVRRQLTIPNGNLMAGARILILEELPLAGCVLLPYLLYMFFRADFGSTRSFAPAYATLLDVRVYGVIARSLIKQFGLFPLLFVAGVAFLLKEKSYVSALFSTLVLVAVPLFFAVDTRAYTGYSRFDLFIVPPILAAAVAVVDGLSRRSNTLSLALASLVVAANLYLSPVYLDGSKVPRWGNYLVDTSEHYYPYDQALLWLRAHARDQSFLVGGLYYGYHFEFYWAKYDWQPAYAVRFTGENDDEAQSMSAALTQASQQGYDYVLYQIRGRAIVQPQDASDFCLLKVFANQAHMLQLFARKPNCAGGIP